MSVAFIYLATRVPSMLGNASPLDSWLQTLYFGFSLPRPMARSISSLGLVAGGAAARSATTNRAASSTSGVGGATRSAAELSTPSGGGEQAGRGPRSRS